MSRKRAAAMPPEESKASTTAFGGQTYDKSSDTQPSKSVLNSAKMYGDVYMGDDERDEDSSDDSDSDSDDSDSDSDVTDSEGGAGEQDDGEEDLDVDDDEGDISTKVLINFLGKQSRTVVSDHSGLVLTTPIPSLAEMFAQTSTANMDEEGQSASIVDKYFRELPNISVWTSILSDSDDTIQWRPKLSWTRMRKERCLKIHLAPLTCRINSRCFSASP